MNEIVDLIDHPILDVLMMLPIADFMFGDNVFNADRE
jgi:hypothetical protein